MSSLDEIIKSGMLKNVEELLEKAIETKKASLNAEVEYKKEKARLRLETDWNDVSDTRMTDKDKDAYVNFHSLPLKEQADDLKAEADYQWELWELQKIVLRKGGCNHN